MHKQQKKKPLPKPTKWRKAFNHIKWRTKNIAFYVLLFLPGFLIILYGLLPTFINDWMVERNPIKVMAEITYIYDTRGGGRFHVASRRVYCYKFRYRNKIYHDCFNIGDTRDYCGGIGDTLVIQCNKDNPNFSRYYYYDNLDRLITVDEYSEEGKKLRKEIPKGEGYLKGFREIINDFKKGKEERERQANASAEHKQD